MTAPDEQSTANLRKSVRDSLVEALNATEPNLAAFSVEPVATDYGISEDNVDQLIICGYGLVWLVSVGRAEVKTA